LRAYLPSRAFSDGLLTLYAPKCVEWAFSEVMIGA
jgi:hypothetical protein